MQTNFDILFFVLSTLLTFMLMAIFLNGTRAANKSSDPEEALEVRRMHFAAGVVLGLCYILVLSMLMAFMGDGENSMGARVFDNVKTFIPPIITLVLGYYFGSTKSHINKIKP